MAKETKLNIVVSVKDNFSRGLDKLKGTLGSSFTGVKTAIASATTGILAFTAAVGTAVMVAKKLLDAWAEEEQNLRSLNDALVSHGYNLDESRAKVDAFVNSLQAVSGVADDQARTSIKTLMDMNMSLADAMKATQVAADLSAAKNISLETSVGLLGKAYNGNIGMLSRYGIVIDEAEFKSKGFSVVLDDMAVFAGRAASQVETMAGKVAQMKLYAGDAKEEIGKGLAVALMQAGENALTAAGGVEGMSTAVEKLSKWVATSLVPSLSAAIEIMAALGKNLKNMPIFGIVEGVQQIRAGKGVGKGLGTMLASFDKQNAGFLETWKKIADITSPENMNKRRAEALKMFEALGMGSGVAPGQPGTPPAPGGDPARKQEELNRLAEEAAKNEREKTEELERQNELKRTQIVHEQELSNLAEQHNAELQSIRETTQAEIEASRESVALLQEALDVEKSRNVYSEHQAALTDEIAKKNAERNEESKRSQIEQIQQAVEMNDKALQLQGLESGTLEMLSQQLVFLEKQNDSFRNRTTFSKEQYDLLIREKELQAEIEKLKHPEGDIAREYQKGKQGIEAQARSAAMLGEEFDRLNAEIDITKRQLESLITGNADPRTIAAVQQRLMGLGAAREGQEANSAARQKMESDMADLQGMVSDAFSTGMSDGWDKGLSGFADAIKQRVMKGFADAMAARIMGGENGLLGMFGGMGGGFEQQGAGQVFGMGGGGGGGAAGFLGALSANASAGNVGMGAVQAAQAGGAGGGGGFLSGLFGGGGAGGAAGLFGKVMPWLGAAMLVSSFFKKGGGPVQQTGVDPIFGRTTVTGGDMTGLYGSEAFNRAAYSARNAGGAALGAFRDARVGGPERVAVEVSIKGDARDMIAAQVTRQSTRTQILGTPKRTGKNSG